MIIGQGLMAAVFERDADGGGGEGWLDQVSE